MRCLAPIAAAVLLAVPLPAAAQWQHRAPSASDDLGSAFIRNAEGYILDVGCGNAGTVSISLSPCPPETAGMSKPMFDFVIGGRDHRLPVSCTADGCNRDLMLGGEVFPPAEVGALVSALRAEARADVQVGGRTAARFTLAGSSAALGTLKARTSCDGL
jgi:hypothetical protein